MIYLDDDSVDPLLIRLLRNAKHDVMVPADIGNAGSADAIHFLQAIRAGRPLLSRNRDDFLDLHELILEAKGHHPGVLMVCQDNDPTRDLKPGHIVRAIRNLLRAGIPLGDEFHILNHWR
jgi:hypothetical protein